MSERARWLLVAGGLGALCCCGEPPPSAIALSIHRGDALLWEPTDIDVRVYGAQAACGTLTAAVVADTLADAQCGPEDRESGSCFIVRTSISYTPTGETARLAVPIGERAVLVIGEHSLYGLSAVGCSRATIEEGKTAKLDIVLDDVNL